MPRPSIAHALRALAILALLGCGQDREREQDPLPAHIAVASTPSASVPAQMQPPASSAPAASSAVGSSASPAGAPLARRDGCPDGMLRVEGDYCPNVEQECIKHHPEYERDQEKRRKAEAKGQKYKSTVSERCLEYRSPSRCLSKEKRRLSFCIDTYEYPNVKGELPALLISWTEARKTCAAAGKRLCSEVEFDFACEGPEMLPYTYGYVRDAAKCSIDKDYRKREKKLFPYEKCMSKPACKQHLEKLDQRLPTGSLPACVSPFGVHDMNGNINEWVELPGKKYPDRSGLKGGWWGPVRGRCRPTVDFHKEDDYGYEEGFRCCADVR